jgi:hypothetical protein
VLLLFNIRRPRRMIELSNVTQVPSRTLAENSPFSDGTPKMTTQFLSESQSLSRRCGAILQGPEK